MLLSATVPPPSTSTESAPGQRRTNPTRGCLAPRFEVRSMERPKHGSCRAISTFCETRNGLHPSLHVRAWLPSHCPTTIQTPQSGLPPCRRPMRRRLAQWHLTSHLRQRIKKRLASLTRRAEGHEMPSKRWCARSHAIGRHQPVSPTLNSDVDDHLGRARLHRLAQSQRGFGLRVVLSASAPSRSRSGRAVELQGLFAAPSNISTLAFMTISFAMDGG